MKKDIVIVGAGLVGSLLSIYLAKRGHLVRIFERRADMRRSKTEAGRSINLALSDRGLLSLERVGLADEIKKIAIPMNGRYIHNNDGTVAIQPYGQQGQSINSVSRAVLNKKLMNAAEQHGVQIFFGEKCTAIDWKENEVEFESTITPSTTSVKADIIFAADGAFSGARLQHQLHHERFDFQQHYIDCSYKELTIPTGAGNRFLLEKNFLHIWPRKDYMLIALPNLEGNFTCTLFFPFQGELSFQQLDTEEKVLAFFEKNFPDTIKLMPDLTRQFFSNPVSALVTVKCYPWIREDKFALIGDAAHAIVPFFGQGMNCGFEDCRVLDELLEKNGDDWSLSLEQYQMLRKPDADAIADMAVNNFIEMREKTADPKFLLQKKIEARLHEKYPDKWIPAYTQVTFSPQIRYSDAFRNAMRQEEIMRHIMLQPGIEDNWDSKEVESAILSMLSV